MKLVQKVTFFFELRSFGVSEWWGRKLGVGSEKVRLFFIYSSFIALGSPVVLYFIMAFIKENKHFLTFRRKPKTIWEL